VASSKNGSTGARPGGAGTPEEAPTATFAATDDTAASGSKPTDGGGSGKGSGSSGRNSGSSGKNAGSSGKSSGTSGKNSGSSGKASSSSGKNSGPSGKGAGTGTGAKGSGAKTGASSNASRTASAGSANSSAAGAGRGASRTPAKTSKAPTSASRGGGPRRIRLTLSRVDPFSVMKMSFLIAIAVGIATVVAVAVLWNLVEVIGIWDKIDEIGRDLNNDKPLPFMEYFQFSKMISYATIAAVVDIVIITALGTLFAFLYNIVAALLGGLKMTFTDE
jgi:hypothetical protein